MVSGLSGEEVPKLVGVGGVFSLREGTGREEVSDRRTRVLFEERGEGDSF